jgi:copper chaperone CopZ
MKNIKVQIKGMHCKSCEALLEDALEDIGAKESKIDHKSGIAKVTYDEQAVTIDKIKKAITDEGYSVTKIEVK